MIYQTQQQQLCQTSNDCNFLGNTPNRQFCCFSSLRSSSGICRSNQCGHDNTLAYVQKNDFYSCKFKNTLQDSRLCQQCNQNNPCISKEYKYCWGENQQFLQCNFQKGDLGQFCIQHDDCKSNICNNQKKCDQCTTSQQCQQIFQKSPLYCSNEIFLQPSLICKDVQSGIGFYCTQNSDCITGLCNSQRKQCIICNQRLQCCNQYCIGQGLNVQLRQCKNIQAQIGEGCLSNYDCVSGICSNNICQYCSEKNICTQDNQIQQYNVNKTYCISNVSQNELQCQQQIGILDQYCYRNQDCDTSLCKNNMCKYCSQISDCDQDQYCIGQIFEQKKCISQIGYENQFVLQKEDCITNNIDNQFKCIYCSLQNQCKGIKDIYCTSTIQTQNKTQLICNSKRAQINQLCLRQVDCDQGLLCQNNTCVNCINAQCNNQQYCHGNSQNNLKCNQQQAQIGQFCKQNRDCLSGICNITCTQCQNSQQCQNNQYCIGKNNDYDKQCQIQKGQNGEFCNIDEDCLYNFCNSSNQCSYCNNINDCQQFCVSSISNTTKQCTQIKGQNNQFCVSDFDCQSNLCINNQCRQCNIQQNCTNNRYCIGNTQNQMYCSDEKGIIQQFCFKSNDCETNYCQLKNGQYTCQYCSSNSQCNGLFCSGQTQNTRICTNETSSVGLFCTNNLQCQSKLCFQQYCQYCGQEFQCTNNLYCYSNNYNQMICNTNLSLNGFFAGSLSDCESKLLINNTCVQCDNQNQCTDIEYQYCINNKCQNQKLQNQQQCNTSIQCQSNNCVNNICKQCSLQNLCQNNLYCINDICQNQLGIQNQKCLNNIDCEGYCDNNTCKSCNTDSNCIITGREYCIQGKCQQISQNNEICYENNDCVSKLCVNSQCKSCQLSGCDQNDLLYKYCINNICSDQIGQQNDQCYSNMDCEGYCDNNICKNCVVDQNCTILGKEYCIQGKCQQGIQNNYQCQQNNDCISRLCVNQQCVSCSLSGCDQNDLQYKYCVNNICSIYIGQEYNQCYSNQDCDGYCNNNMCSSCSSDQNCVLQDRQYCIQGKCQRGLQINEQCSENDDCLSKLCIDQSCKSCQQFGCGQNNLLYKYCVNNVCSFQIGYVNDQCYDNIDCEGYCDNNVCKNCISDQNCLVQNRQYCIQGKCQQGLQFNQSCVQNDDCISRLCLNGYCNICNLFGCDQNDLQYKYCTNNSCSEQIGQLNDQCYDNQDCDGYCNNNVCENCQSDLNCIVQNRKFCIQGKCQQGIQNNQSCSQNDDCISRLCIQQQCKTCDIIGCQQSDSVYKYCVNSVCSAQIGQIENQCNINSDCQSQQCYQNICKNCSQIGNCLLDSQSQLGISHSFILNINKDVFSTGNNQFGQLGLQNNVNSNIFRKIDKQQFENEEVEQIQVGGSHSFVLTILKNIFVVGRNNYGQLGLSNTNNINTFQKLNPSIFNNEEISQIQLGDYHSFVLTKNNSIYVCGWNSFGQLGIQNQIFVSSFQKLLQSDFYNQEIQQIYTGGAHSFVLTKNNDIFVAGLNSNGQLGIQNFTNMNRFQQLNQSFLNNEEVSLIYLATWHSFILTKNDSLFSCGSNSKGQLGLKDNISKNSFQRVNQSVFNNEQIKQIAGGDEFSTILTKNGSIYVCGTNSDGQLGIPSINGTNVFTKINQTNFNNELIKQIFTGDEYQFLLSENGSVFIVGRNINGQLGIQSNTNINVFQKLNLTYFN